MMKQRWMLALAACVLTVLPARAADHMVGQDVAGARLEAAAQARQSDLGTLDVLLDSDSARDAASRLGHGTAELKQGLRGLSDSELRDLAQRAEALGADPVAGLSSDVNQLLIIFLIIAIVILVLQAVD
jgi:hypothetical protein